MNPHLSETKHPRTRKRVRRTVSTDLASRTERAVPGGDARCLPVGPGRALHCAPPRLELLPDASLRLHATARLDPPGDLIGRVVVRAAVVDREGIAMIGNRLPVDDVVAVLMPTGAPGEYAVDVEWPSDARLAGVLSSGLGLTLALGWDGLPDASVAGTWFRRPRGALRCVWWK